MTGAARQHRGCKKLMRGPYRDNLSRNIQLRIIFIPCASGHSNDMMMMTVVMIVRASAFCYSDAVTVSGLYYEGESLAMGSSSDRDDGIEPSRRKIRRRRII
jgi:hypothetical protein